MTTTFYAHTLPDRPEAEWEPLEDHLREVAELAGDFAAAFGAKDWGHLAGLWHDLGKYSQEFQDYLKRASAKEDSHGEDIALGGGRVDHSTAGAQHSAETITQFGLGRLLAYLIAGHHAGLPDGVELRERLQKKIFPWAQDCPDERKEGSLSQPPLAPNADAPPASFRLGFFLRMVFSALVDADFIRTEAFMAPERAAHRPYWPDDLLMRMEEALVQRLSEFGEPENRVDEQRLFVRQACEAAVSEPPGFFDLTVPTGGGKTLSSLLFALRHAQRHGMRRVIYAIPFTSIIEQNADVFRDVFKALAKELTQDVVIEHHSNLQPEKETTRNRLASENWDAPLVVTTNVQLLESLYACRTSRCRKLHRLANSVIVLDEAQALPIGLLHPILTALRCLVQDYGCTVVLCTATQPALEHREGFSPGIPVTSIRPIIKDRATLYDSLRRTEVHPIGAQTNEALRSLVRAESAGALIVVNTTKAARDFYSCLGDDIPRFHLSARMCPAHRTSVLDQVKLHLQHKEPVALVSTQLIEAGVDVSFPAVFRAECGIDSLAQAAGRCNRHGELRDEEGREIMGRVYLFDHEDYSIPRMLVDLRDAAADTAQLLEKYASDLLSLSAIEHYFRLHIWTVGQRTNQWDHPDVMGCFPTMAGPDWQFTLQFREADRRFQIIPQATHPLIIPWGKEGVALCDELRDMNKFGRFPTRAHFRRAQRLTVQVYEWEWKRLLFEERAEPLLDGAIHVLVHPENDYDKAFGLRPPNAPDSTTAFMV
jgi:CRISPR-associated endonuclease/helicase Cas3